MELICVLVSDELHWFYVDDHCAVGKEKVRGHIAIADATNYASNIHTPFITKAQYLMFN